jgi:hypothetical protein
MVTPLYNWDCPTDPEKKDWVPAEGPIAGAATGSVTRIPILLSLNGESVAEVHKHCAARMQLSFRLDQPLDTMRLRRAESFIVERRATPR